MTNGGYNNPINNSLVTWVYFTAIPVLTNLAFKPRNG